MNWDVFFTGLAEYVSKKSKDKSTKVGAVLVGKDNEVLSIGYNGFPRGVDDYKEEYHNRPTKYLITSHAEENACCNAARQGIKLLDSTLYLMYEPVPCATCTRLIIQCGIKEIVGTMRVFPGFGQQWKEEMKYSSRMLNETGIKIRCIDA